MSQNYLDLEAFVSQLQEYEPEYLEGDELEEALQMKMELDLKRQRLAELESLGRACERLPGDTDDEGDSDDEGDEEYLNHMGSALQHMRVQLYEHCDGIIGDSLKSWDHSSAKESKRQELQKMNDTISHMARTLSKMRTSKQLQQYEQEVDILREIEREIKDLENAIAQTESDYRREGEQEKRNMQVVVVAFVQAIRAMETLEREKEDVDGAAAALEYEQQAHASYLTRKQLDRIEWERREQQALDDRALQPIDTSNIDMDYSSMPGFKDPNDFPDLVSKWLSPKILIKQKPDKKKKRRSKKVWPRLSNMSLPIPKRSTNGHVNNGLYRRLSLGSTNHVSVPGETLNMSIPAANQNTEPPTNGSAMAVVEPIVQQPVKETPNRKRSVETPAATMPSNDSVKAVSISNVEPGAKKTQCLLRTKDNASAVQPPECSAALPQTDVSKRNKPRSSNKCVVKNNKLGGGIVAKKLPLENMLPKYNSRKLKQSDKVPHDGGATMNAGNIAVAPKSLQKPPIKCSKPRSEVKGPMAQPMEPEPMQVDTAMTETDALFDDAVTTIDDDFDVPAVASYTSFEHNFNDSHALNLSPTFNANVSGGDSSHNSFDLGFLNDDGGATTGNGNQKNDFDFDFGFGDEPSTSTNDDNLSDLF